METPSNGNQWGKTKDNPESSNLTDEIVGKNKLKFNHQRIRTPRFIFTAYSHLI